MIHANEGPLINMPGATAATDGTQSMVVDTKGYEQANFYVNVGTHATNGTTLQKVTIGDHDTSTEFSNMSDIVALTGGTELSDSVGFIIPLVAQAGEGTIIELQLDCRKSKRFIGLQITPGTTTVVVSAICRLTRSKESADTAAEKAVSGSNLYSLTDATSVSVIATS